ncbi:Imm10 family immunity protein [Streptomyces sp. NPDC004787]|uniref:Imm10 family immunity protein n=1 Tax=Streptomyces sp. NPDC004787 TaxID=3154291 RepID=UPI0033A6063C
MVNRYMCGPIWKVEESEGNLFLHGGEDGRTWCINIQECYDAEDEQEIELGMDTYCIVSEPGQNCCYGGVIECEIGDQGLYLRLSGETASDLGLDEETYFDLNIPDEEMRTLRRGLKEVLSSGRQDSIPVMRI